MVLLENLEVNYNNIAMCYCCIYSRKLVPLGNIYTCRCCNLTQGWVNGRKKWTWLKHSHRFSGKSAKWSWFPFQSFKIWMNFYKLIEISHSACVFILVQYFVYWLVNKVFYFQLFPRNVLPFHSLGISCILVVYFLLFIMFCLLIMYFSSKLLGHV